MVDNIGMPVSGINMTYNNTGTIGPQDGDIQIKLSRGSRGRPRIMCAELRRAAARALPRRHLLLPAGRHHQPDPEFRRAVADRRAGARRPTCTASFEHANKLLARIRQRAGRRRRAHPAVAQRAGLRRRCRPHARAERRPDDARRHQPLVVNLAGSSQVAPTYWLNPANGVSYTIVMQTPQYRLDSLAALSQPADHGAGGAAAAGAGRHRRHPPRHGQRRGHALRPAGHGAGLCRRAGPRSRRRRRRRPQDRRRAGARSSRPRIRAVKVRGQVQDHGERLLRPAVRPAGRDRADLPADRREFPVVERSLRHHHRPAGGAGRASSGCCSPPTRRCRCRR